MRRRDFIANSSAGLAGSLLLGRRAWASPERAPVQYIRETIPPVHVPAYQGRRYEATVPDTLDLAERAGITLEGVLTRGCDPLFDFETYQEADFSRQPAFMYHSFH